MKRVLAILIIIVMLTSFIGCKTEQRTHNRYNPRDPVVRPTDNSEEVTSSYGSELLSNACGHRADSGHEYSYSTILRLIYGSNGGRVTFENYDYDKLLFSKCLKSSTSSQEIISLKSNFVYVLCKCTAPNTNDVEIIFAYNLFTEKVVACFWANESATFEDCYIECWDVFEKTFCEGSCMCDS